MINIGQMNRLTVSRMLDFGLALDAGEEGEVLLANKEVPEGAKEGDSIDVFLYLDGDAQLAASTKTPKVQVNEVGYLKAVSIGRSGAFLDWGLPKDLMVHVSQQLDPMVEGESYLVYVYFDEEHGRIAASAKINRYLDLSLPEYEENEQVDLIIAEKSDIGVKAIVNGRHWGVIHFNEIFKNVDYGMKVKGYISRVRDDHKIDLRLQAAGYQKVDGVALKILNKVKSANGFIGLNDKSAPEQIYNTFGVSKKVFKQAIGSLYKQRHIRIEKDGVYIVEND